MTPGFGRRPLARPLPPERRRPRLRWKPWLPREHRGPDRRHVSLDLSPGIRHRGRIRAVGAVQGRSRSRTERVPPGSLPGESMPRLMRDPAGRQMGRFHSQTGSMPGGRRRVVFCAHGRRRKHGGVRSRRSGQSGNGHRRTGWNASPYPLPPPDRRAPRRCGPPTGRWGEDIGAAPGRGCDVAWPEGCA